MWYSITGAFRSTGEDATEVIEADSEEEAIAKANDRGILVQEVTQTRRPRMDKLIGVLALMVMAFAYVASGDGCSFVGGMLGLVVGAAAMALVYSLPLLWLDRWLVKNPRLKPGVERLDWKGSFFVSILALLPTGFVVWVIVSAAGTFGTNDTATLLMILEPIRALAVVIIVGALLSRIAGPRGFLVSFLAFVVAWGFVLIVIVSAWLLYTANLAARLG